MSNRLTSRENGKLEFKEAFDLGSADKYAKTAAAFANAQGGYIVFGVMDSPRQMMGLKSSNFENFDGGKLTAALNAPAASFGRHFAIPVDGAADFRSTCLNRMVSGIAHDQRFLAFGLKDD